MPLKEIFCQDKAINALQLAYAGDKVAHAYIFAGPEGVGKFTAAREFAKLLLCKNPVKINDFNDSCGKCDSCRQFETGSHPDFEHAYKELVKFTEGGKDRETPVDFPIDVVREFLLDKVRNKPTLSSKRVFILSEAEKLNDASQNCLLKVLEEPPAYCCIILICTRPDRLLPTIRSRCQIMRFGTIDEDTIIKKLKETGLNEQQSRFFARFSQGSIGLAITYAKLEQNEANLYHTKQVVIDSICELEYKDALETAENLQKRAKETAEVWNKLTPGQSKTDINRRASKTIIQVVMSALRDAMLINLGKEKEIVNFDQSQQLRKLTQRFDCEQAAKKIADCFRMFNWIESSVNEKLIFDSFLLNLAQNDKITAKL